MQCQMKPQNHISAIHSGLNSIAAKSWDSGVALPKFKSQFSHLLPVYKTLASLLNGALTHVFHKIVEMIKWINTYK